MARTQFYKNIVPALPKQGVTRCPPRIKLSAEARKILKIQHRTTAMSYQEDLNNAWAEIEAIKDKLAAKYSKSCARVGVDLHGGRGSLTKGRQNKTSAWNAFIWKMRQIMGEGTDPGCGVLTDITQDANLRARYEATSNKECELYVQELERYKATNAKAQRISARSKTNDIMHTVAAIEDELVNLGLQTNAEAMLVVVKGSTNMTTKPRLFTTERVENFLAGTLKMDPGDFVTHMEGCAIGGLRGAANHKNRLSSAWTFLRELINTKLVEVTGDAAATMKWTQYWWDIVTKYRVVVDGWPNSIPFGNLSDVVKTLHEYESLTRKWQKGKIFFKTLSEQEFAEMDEDQQQQIDNGEIDIPTRKTCSDKGQKRVHLAEGGGLSQKRKRTRAGVSSDERSSTWECHECDYKKAEKFQSIFESYEGKVELIVWDGGNSHSSNEGQRELI
ncbi:hypothetical protein JAAARDRAFT_56629 [Jaapia argillacea MUCL 33604]|uniref:Uncharacterized protein n=1 Tax=Jaapia argillacea MUCL 33604 TaxID=933084 RepID=A0A067Q0E4_9AGAM|nr:hypothetical protein JAAARDRAFT_56629 [Jaapia argillacea MUCL 33604]